MHSAVIALADLEPCETGDTTFQRAVHRDETFHAIATSCKPTRRHRSLLLSLVVIAGTVVFGFETPLADAGRALIFSSVRLSSRHSLKKMTIWACTC